MKKPIRIATAAIRDAIVLSVGMSDVDRIALEHILHESGAGAYTKTEWSLMTRSTLALTFSVLREFSIPIVLCDCDLMPGAWREMLELSAVLPHPPLVIVTSRLADERLWAEALNLGAYDVLVKPFDTNEAIRILGLAWEHWGERHGVHNSRTKQRTAVA
jgi:DNA-binding NtrC family response regulator